MLGIFFIYYIGKQFYNLAHEHYKKEWIYAVTGVISYYLGTFIAGIIIYLALDLLQADTENSMDLLINVIGVIFGGLMCWLYYFLLKRNWEKQPYESENPDILDDYFLEE